MKRIDWKENTNVDLIKQKYEELKTEAINTIGEDKLNQVIPIDNKRVEEMYEYLKEFYYWIARFNDEFPKKIKLKDFNADEVNAEDFKANKEVAKKAYSTLLEIEIIEPILYEHIMNGKISLYTCYTLSKVLELLHELNYYAKRVWCCGKPIEIDRCLENIFTNFYKCIGINASVVHAGKPVNPKMDITDLILGIKINPYWF